PACPGICRGTGPELSPRLRGIREDAGAGDRTLAVGAARRLARGAASHRAPKSRELADEFIPDTADCADDLRIVGFVFKITAKADDEVVDGAGVCILVEVPDIFQNGL